MRADAVHVETVADDQRARGWLVFGCDTLLAIAREPVFAGGVCHDCRAPVTGELVLHRSHCLWVAAVDHLANHRCAPAHVRALLRGWAILRGGKR